MLEKHSRDAFSNSRVSSVTRGILARAAHALGSAYALMSNATRTYTDRHGRVLPERRAPTADHLPRSDCEELVQDYVQLLAKYQRLKEALVEEQIAKAEAQKVLADLEAAHAVLRQQHHALYNELLATRRNRDRLRDESVLLKNKIRSMRRLNGLVREAYTQMAKAYLDGVSEGRLVKRARKWLEK